MKREPNITEQQAREIVEKMGRRESYTPKSMDDLYRRIGLEPDEPGAARQYRHGGNRDRYDG